MDDRRTRFSSVLAWMVLAFLLMPSLIVVPLSFGNERELVFPPSTFSLNLYRQYFSDPEWISATILSFKVALGSTFLALVLGVPAAYGLVRARFPGRRALTLLLVSPLTVPAVAIALALYIYFVQIRLSDGVLRLVVGMTVITIPYVVITAMAGLRHIDPALETAARVMGAGPLRIFWQVTLPLLRPAIVGSGLLAFLMAFDEVVIALFVARAGTVTLPVKMFSSVQWEISPVLAAVATLLTAAAAVVCLMTALAGRTEEGHS